MIPVPSRASGGAFGHQARAAFFQVLVGEAGMNAYQTQTGNDQNRSHDRGLILDRHCFLLESATIAALTAVDLRA
jgi:hypothetical protein